MINEEQPMRAQSQEEKAAQKHFKEIKVCEREIKVTSDLMKEELALDDDYVSFSNEAKDSREVLKNHKEKMVEGSKDLGEWSDHIKDLRETIKDHKGAVKDQALKAYKKGEQLSLFDDVDGGTFKVNFEPTFVRQKSEKDKTVGEKIMDNIETIQKSGATITIKKGKK